MSESASDHSSSELLCCQSLVPDEFDTTRCSLVEGTPCDACKEIEGIDAGIRRFNSSVLPENDCDDLKALSQKRQKILKEEINALHDPLIRYLPVEIILQVFLHLVEAQQPFINGYAARFRKVDCSAPLVLSAVCRTWREIALDTPQLWTSPNVFLYSFELEKISLQQELIREWLGRSGQFPLHISFFCTRSIGSDFGALRPVFDTVKTHSSRWRSLQLILSGHCYPTFLTDLTCTSSLRYLRLRPRLDDDARGPKFILSQSTELEDLRIHNLVISDLNVKWTKLTVFHLKSISVDEIFEVLRRCSKLEKCVFMDISPSRSTYPVHFVHTTYPCLRDMELHSSESTQLEFVLERLSLPSLERLVYSDTSIWNGRGPCRAFPLQPFLSLFSRSQCSLRTFEIQGPYASVADGELMEVLECLPSVERLSLGSSGVHPLVAWLSDQFFTDHGNFVSLSRLLPRIEELCISGTRAFTWGALLAFLNLAHFHVIAAQRSHINFRLDLDCEPHLAFDYIERHIISQLINAKWDKTISLRIMDRIKRKDLIQASLQYYAADLGPHSNDQDIDEL